ncbi:hypothetical protein [Cellulomonas sp. KH9]|uniref:hypothetical protein n=1 Tax=Cellulomonas sp. KH9 TaxID=1855324 RepID=UPI0008E8E5B4|nr:hypothetical protein [Cellulomonas sp. KH9]SFK32297.1 hypothetical protein SAMN05216467_2885 [Cellulomonas sp. KH9]
MSDREASAPCAHYDGSEVVMGLLGHGYDPPRAFVRIGAGEDGLVNPTVADLLRAVAEAFDVKVVPADAIVIEAVEVEAASLGLITNSLTAEKARELAVRYLALAEYLRANPPVDRAAVASLIQAFAEAGARIEGATFEDLVQAGVRVEVTP